MPLVLLVIAALQAQVPAASVAGSWKSPGGNSIITIAPCGAALCGTVAWASESAKKAALRTTDQLVGTQLLTQVQQGRDGRWHGKLFIPDKNMRVTAKLQLKDAQQLRVSGCAVGKTLCKDTIWVRTDGTLPS